MAINREEFIHKIKPGLMANKTYKKFFCRFKIDEKTYYKTFDLCNVRSVFNKNGGSLGTSGSLDFIFTRKSMFTVAPKEGFDSREQQACR